MGGSSSSADILVKQSRKRKQARDRERIRLIVVSLEQVFIISIMWFDLKIWRFKLKHLLCQHRQENNNRKMHFLLGNESSYIFNDVSF
jgi:hypothetical protein